MEMLRGKAMRKRNQFIHLIVLIFILALPCSLFAQQGEVPSKTTSLPQVSNAEVRFNGKTLFEIKVGIASFTPEQRAKAITERIESLTKDPLLRLDDLKASEVEEGAVIGYGDRTIMTISIMDARVVGRTAPSLAQEYTEKIRNAVKEKQAQYSLRSILFSIMYALISTAVLIAILILFKGVFPKIYGVVRSWEGTKVRSIKIQNFEALSAERLIGMLITCVRGFRIFLTIVLFYFYTPLVFSFFPWTQGYAGILFGYLAYPFKIVGKAILDYLPNLFFLAVIGVITYYAIKLIRLLFNELEKGTLSIPGFYQDWAIPTFKIVRFLLVVFALVMAFPYLPGSESPAFKGVSIFLGVLFSLGSTSAVANVVAGLILNYTRAFNIGDRVRIGDVEGDILFKTLLVTHIRTIKNVEITLPNSTVIGGAIHNFSSTAKNSALILHTSVTIGYDAPWRRVHELLVAAAKSTRYILENPHPFVLQTALNDFYVSYQINAYTDHPHEMVQIYSELHQNIQDKFNEGGVEIMSPHYTQLRDGNTTTIPENYRPADYSAPGLRITKVDQAKPESQ
jgi:small-conductance mechanosensitive channel